MVKTVFVLFLLSGVVYSVQGSVQAKSKASQNQKVLCWDKFCEKNSPSTYTYQCKDFKRTRVALRCLYCRYFICFFKYNPSPFRILVNPNNSVETATSSDELEATEEKLISELQNQQTDNVDVSFTE